MPQAIRRDAAQHGPADVENDEPVVSRPMSLKAALSPAAVLVLLFVATRAAGSGGRGRARRGDHGRFTCAAVDSGAHRGGAAPATNTVVKLGLATVTGGPRLVAAVALGMAW